MAEPEVSSSPRASDAWSWSFVNRKLSLAQQSSRYKFRKLLGLNCDSKGETYSSKVSQMLGNSEIMDRFEPPRLFRLWFTASAAGSHLIYAFQSFKQPEVSLETAFLHLALALIFGYCLHQNSKPVLRFLVAIVFSFANFRLFYITPEVSLLAYLECLNVVASAIYFLLMCNIGALFERRKWIATTNWLTDMLTCRSDHRHRLELNGNGKKHH